jgi:hypothetical protein
MPKLPSVLDYGQRPSLQSNRLDRPDQSGLMMAEEFATAARTFAQLAGEKKAKDDRLNYSLAKNELLQADIASRESLNDREDFDKFDADYTNGYQQRAEQVFGKYALSPSDRALLGAESDMIRTRGRVYAGDLSRQKRLDWQRGELESNLDASAEQVMVAPPDLQADLLNTQLESITAAIEQGVLGDADGKAMARTYTKAVATGALEKMDPEDRIKELELSLAHRDARGAISPEELAKGGGTGSIADYLHADVAKKMLEQTKKESELNLEHEIAKSYVDSVMAEEPVSRKAGMKILRERMNAAGVDAKAQWRAESMANARYNETEQAEQEQAVSMLRSSATLMREGDADGNTIRYEDLPADELAILSPQQDDLLRKYSESLANGRQFGTMDHYARPKGAKDANGNLIIGSFEEWADLTEAEKEVEDLFHPAWRMGLTENGWNRIWNEQRDIRQRTERGVGAGSQDNVQTNDQIVASVVPSLTSIPATGRSQEQNEIYQRIRAEHADRVAEIQKTEYSGKKAPYEVRKNELLKMLAEDAYVRRYDFGIDWLDTDERKKMYEIPADELGDAYIPLSEWESRMTTDIVGGVETPISWKQKLINRGKARSETGREPTTEDLESAYFAVRAGMTDAEIDRRLQGGR